MEVAQFYKDHWTEYPLELSGVITHLQDLYPNGVNGKKVLDAGCGSGMVSVAFSTLGAAVTGVDVTYQCIENSRNNARRFGVECRFIQADLVTLDLGEQFDVVYSWGVLHHTPDAHASFSRIASHLTDDGEIIIAVYLKTRLSNFWNAIRVFYQHSPKLLKTTIRKTTAALLSAVDVAKHLVGAKQRYMMRGTSNEEIVNDWFGVPHRTFHTYDEVFGWFQESGLTSELVNPATGRFKSTSNFVVRGTRKRSR